MNTSNKYFEISHKRREIKFPEIKFIICFDSWIEIISYENKSWKRGT